MDITIAAVVAVALIFDFTNGFHDTANAIAATVSTRAVPPKIAVIGAALFNFLGAFVSLKVAATVAKGIVSPQALTLHVILAGLFGAIIWNLITWRQGLPTSSSHSLIGGIVGASAMALGLHVIKWQGLGGKVLVPSLVSPFLGLAGAALLTLMVVRIVRKRSKKGVDRVFKRLQVISGSFVAFTHGTNDAQKTMGVIALALLVAHPGQAFHVPVWVILASATAMAAGTLAGGWRIIHTLGQKITKIEPQQGFAADTSTASVLFLTAHFGFPVSTTHTVSGSILGAGAVTRRNAVDWHVVRHIITAWIITLPCAAAVGAAMELVSRLPGSTGIVLSVGLVLVAVIYGTRNWTWETVAQIKGRFSMLRRRRDESKI